MNKYMSIVIAFGLLFGISVANATTVTYTSNTTTPSASRSAYGDITLKQFDPSLGTLTGVGVTVFANLSKQGWIQNFGQSDGSFVFTFLASDIRLTRQNQTSLFPYQNTTSESIVTVDVPTYINFPDSTHHFGDGQSPWSTQLDLSETVFESLNLLASDWGMYEGTGSTTQLLAMTNSSSVTGLQSFTVGGPFLIGGYATITYTYDLVNDPNSVPEPATLPLFCLGLISLLGIRRRH